MRCHARRTHAGLPSGTTDDWIGLRPPGSSCREETSRSPNTVIAMVRGIGVAVITSTCGNVPSGAFRRKESRCSTPKRCCSSMTTKRSEEHTSELQSRFDLVCRLLLDKKQHDT